MAEYFVDYENVAQTGLKGIDTLNKTDVVHLFYTKSNDRLSFDTHSRINSSPATVKLHKVASGGKNALDFQLSSFLGSRMEGSKAQLVVVSKDKGFECLKTFWGDRVRTAVDLTGKAQRTQKELAVEVGKLVDDERIAEALVRLIPKYKTKQGLNNALMRELKPSAEESKKFSEALKAIKPLLTDMK